jgi:hypothetical protein
MQFLVEQVVREFHPKPTEMDWKWLEIEQNQPEGMI